MIWPCNLSEGNPGALSALMECTKICAAIDPDSALGPFTGVIGFDTYGIYGPRIWMLYKDVCQCDAVATLALLRAVQLSIITDDKLDYAINNRGDGIDVAEVYGKVKERLPKFDSLNQMQLTGQQP